MVIELDGPNPIYCQIACVIRERISDGTYKLERTIPSEAEACDEFGVSRRTARAAYALLKDEGLILRVPGRGTFAVKRPE